MGTLQVRQGRTLVLQLEKELAHAHQYLWRAALLSETMRDQSLADDLHQLAQEVRRLEEDMLKKNTAAWSSVRTRT